MGTVCLVEDEENLIELIKLNLELEGFKVECFKNGKIAADHFSANCFYDLIILDVMLPEVSGFKLCELIRQNSNVPILFLSAKGTTQDRIQGLKLGANDYLVKPFDLEELLLRVNVLTQSKLNTDLQEFKISNNLIDFLSFHVKNEKGIILYEFSKKEMSLLEFFIKNEGRVVSRDELLDNVWGTDQFPTSRTIDNFILTFRKLFEVNPKIPKHFHSIRGVGYKFTS
ncbi:MAG TPA: DNA-binding response regulator [Crocinitomicaceae bacterium]|nr:DNA-binding response regulator [Flavobacteriales bacterium]HBW85568.1 DNA-binding response regulator [Crocinitomicaceae bacterium]